MAGVPQPPQHPPDTNGNLLQRLQKYIVKAKANLIDVYGPMADVTLIFDRYTLGDGLYHPQFMDEAGVPSGKPSSSYTYTPVPQPGGRRHKKKTRRNKNKKQTRRRKMRR